MSFCVGYRSAPGQDTGVDGCTTNRLCIASKPPTASSPPHDGMSSLGGSLLTPPPLKCEFTKLLAPPSALCTIELRP
ncbi:hypothetical protein PBY51_007439 [Eleginops maclovinus]|uniref:Uncharacterized protein n=1 Tax=Eleginops maclovinus TaxID=56733 RepID=A0AAN7X6E0_ELEMC|nr:hypothetical protein PBY51_007439 [Eleginops maclovinus]